MKSIAVRIGDVVAILGILGLLFYLGLWLLTEVFGWRRTVGEVEILGPKSAVVEFQIRSGLPYESYRIRWVAEEVSPVTVRLENRSDVDLDVATGYKESRRIWDVLPPGESVEVSAGEFGGGEILMGHETGGHASAALLIECPDGFKGQSQGLLKAWVNGP